MTERKETAKRQIYRKIKKLAKNRNAFRNGSFRSLPLDRKDLAILYYFALKVFENKMRKQGIWTVERAIRSTIETVEHLIFIEPDKFSMLRDKCMDALAMEKHLLKSAEIA